MNELLKYKTLRLNFELKRGIVKKIDNDQRAENGTRPPMGLQHIATNIAIRGRLEMAIKQTCVIVH